jgi:hypothetical protein
MLANAPLAIAGVLQLLRPASDDTYERESQVFQLLAGTADCAEGTAAFLAKRPPAFAGR